jgi:hypothetical protein
MEYPKSNDGYDTNSMSQNMSTNASQYSQSSNNMEYNWENNTPNTPTSPSGFSSYALYSAQSSGVQLESYTDANFETAFEGGSTSRPTVNALGLAMNSPILQLYSFIVSKGEEPHFKLNSPWTPTLQTPEKIYLDHAK